MKRKNLDIKTVDMFAEIFSDPKKFNERMSEMREVRDEIRADLGMIDSKDKAEHLLRQAADKTASASDYENRVNAENTEKSARLTVLMNDHQKLVEKDRDLIAREKTKLSTDRGQFTRTSVALKKDLEDRLEKVEKREDAVGLAEADLAKRKKDHEEYVKRVKAAV